jgi:hypothetical protein
MGQMGRRRWIPWMGQMGRQAIPYLMLVHQAIPYLMLVHQVIPY